jgi:hypothetical protein
MMGTKVRSFAPLCNRSIDDLVPAGNFYRHLEAKLDLGFVRDVVRDTYKECGRPSVDPLVFFKLQLVPFFDGLRSERELVRVAADRLSVRWYLGYDLDEKLRSRVIYPAASRCNATSADYRLSSPISRTGFFNTLRHSQWDAYTNLLSL